MIPNVLINCAFYNDLFLPGTKARASSFPHCPRSTRADQSHEDRLKGRYLDILVVSPLGAFVVTAMQLRGRVTPGPDAETLNVVNEEREAMVHTSPLRRQAAAVRCLRALLAQYACPVESLAVAATHPCTVHPLLPESILEADELYHYLRLHTIWFFSSRQRHVSVVRVVDAIESRLDSRPEAFDEHCARMIARPPG
jgi:hypothetical protein